MNKETDKELLELAAKAAGFVVLQYLPENNLNHQMLVAKLPLYGREKEFPDVFNTKLWNPLVHDGDAFRLAVHLEMLVDPVNRVVAGYSSDICIDIDPEEQEEDSCSAVRKAIVRAAAEIGKGMK